MNHNYELVEFESNHAMKIFSDNERVGIYYPLPYDELVKAYTSPGSVGVTLLCDESPIACGGIINLSWDRGEAWLLNSPCFWKSLKTTYHYVKNTLPMLARLGGFIRVQATSYNSEHCGLFRHLGFTKEGVMSMFGPNKEDATLYAKIFTEEA